MNSILSASYIWGLKRWRARFGFVLDRLARGVGLSAELQKRFRDEVHGLYVGKDGTFDLRRGTLDPWTVHPLHERETNTTIRGLLPTRGGVMLDVGGYCGSFSVRHHDRFERVIIFEPFPRNAEAIERNVALNNAQDQITLVRAAVSARAGHQDLYLDQEDTHSLIASDGRIAMTVQVTTLDDCLREHGIDPSRVRFIKIDVEGAEMDVLRGGEGVITAAYPLIMAEANTDADQDLLTRHLQERGYALYRKTDGRNLIFQHPRQSPEVLPR